MKKFLLSILSLIAAVCLSAQTMPEIISFSLDTSDDGGLSGEKVSVDFGCVATDPNTTIEVSFGDGNYTHGVYTYTVGNESWVNIHQWISKEGVVKIYGDANAIRGLRVGGQKIYSIDVSGAKSLKEFECSDNDITTLDISGNPNLEYLNSSWNLKLESIQFPENSALKRIVCEFNNLTTLDLSSCKDLESLECQSSKLTTLNLSGCKALKGMSCQANKLETLDLSESIHLDVLACMSNELTSLILPNNQSMTALACSSNKLTTLDLSGNLGIYELYCDQNQLTALDLSQHTAMRDAMVGDNKIEFLDLSNSLGLRSVYCQNNMLTELKIAANINVDYITCYNNYLTFASMPSPSQVQFYNWFPQNAVEISVDMSISNVLDLSAQYNIGGVITTYEVFTADDQLLIEDEHYTIDGGKITFLEEYPDGIYCRMSNAAFPLPQEEPVKKAKAEATVFVQTSIIKVLSTVGLCKESQYDMSVYAVGQSVYFNLEEAATYVIYDLTGRKVMSGELSAGNHSAELPNKGIYIVKMNIGGKIISKKL